MALHLGREFALVRDDPEPGVRGACALQVAYRRAERTRLAGARAPRRGPRARGARQENAMNMKLRFLLAATAFTIAGVMSGGADAGALGVSPGLRLAADALASANTVQFIWNGRRYC